MVTREKEASAKLQVMMKEKNESEKQKKLSLEATEKLIVKQKEIAERKNQELGEMARRSDEKTTRLMQTLEYEPTDAASPCSQQMQQHCKICLLVDKAGTLHVKGLQTPYG